MRGGKREDLREEGKEEGKKKEKVDVAFICLGKLVLS